jgi:hypothetical protein
MHDTVRHPHRLAACAFSALLLAVACSPKDIKTPSQTGGSGGVPGTGGVVSTDGAADGAKGSGGTGGEPTPPTGGAIGSLTPTDAEADGAPAPADGAVVDTGSSDVRIADGPVLDGREDKGSSKDAGEDVLPPVAPICGDHHVDPGEQCDDGAANSALAYGRNKCTDKCRTAPFCGDKVTQSNEQCDDGGDMNVGDGYVNTPPPAGRKLCNRQCQFIAPHFCGDGVTDQGHEQCDGQVTCGKDCKLLPVMSMCGNRMVPGTVECNPPTAGQENNHQRYSKTPPPPGVTVFCNGDCEKINSFCGDKKVDRGEECDPAAPPKEGETCGKDCKVVAEPPAPPPPPPPGGQPKTVTLLPTQIHDNVKTPPCTSGECLTSIGMAGGGGVQLACANADPVGTSTNDYKTPSYVELDKKGADLTEAKAVFVISGGNATIECSGVTNPANADWVPLAGGDTLPAPCLARPDALKVRISNKGGATAGCLTVDLFRIDGKAN